MRCWRGCGIACGRERAGLEREVGYGRSEGCARSKAFGSGCDGFCR